MRQIENSSNIDRDILDFCIQQFDQIVRHLQHIVNADSPVADDSPIADELAAILLRIETVSEKLENPEAVVQRCSMKKVFLEILQNSQENNCARVSFLIKLQAWACNFIKKKTLAQVLSCDICKICKNTFFYRTPLVAASENPFNDNRSSIQLT